MAKSKVDRLPPEVRERIGELVERGFTLDEVMDHLAGMPIDPADLPSRSGLGRHVQGLEKVAEKLRRHRVVANAVIQRFGNVPENKQTRLNIEFAHAAVTDLFMAAEDGAADLDGKPVVMNSQSVMFACKAIDHLAHAAKLDADLILKTREEQERKTKAAAVKAAETVAREKGLSADTVAAIKAQILGVKTAAG